MTLDNSVSGYQGFEDPMMQYYGSTADNIPTVYIKSYQTRQFGVGQANTIGRAPSVAAALDSPPTAMTTAETDSITHAPGSPDWPPIPEHSRSVTAPATG